MIRANIKLKRFDSAENLIRDVPEDTYQTEIKLFQAQILSERGEFEDAISLIEPQSEKNWEACFEIGTIYWTMTSYDKSVIYYLKVPKIPKENDDTK